MVLADKMETTVRWAGKVQATNGSLPQVEAYGVSESQTADPQVAVRDETALVAWFALATLGVIIVPVHSFQVAREREQVVATTVLE